MLRKRGVESYLKIGVNNKEEDFSAHAWIEINGNVIDLLEDLEQVFSDLDIKFFSG